jgi:hypothetical protein
LTADDDPRRRREGLKVYEAEDLFKFIFLGRTKAIGET